MPTVEYCIIIRNIETGICECKGWWTIDFPKPGPLSLDPLEILLHSQLNSLDLLRERTQQGSIKLADVLRERTQQGSIKLVNPPDLKAWFISVTAATRHETVSDFLKAVQKEHPQWKLVEVVIGNKRAKGEDAFPVLVLRRSVEVWGIDGRGHPPSGWPGALGTPTREPLRERVQFGGSFGGSFRGSFREPF
jgi:hypothetical protein